MLVTIPSTSPKVAQSESTTYPHIKSCQAYSCQYQIGRNQIVCNILYHHHVWTYSRVYIGMLALESCQVRTCRLCLNVSNIFFSRISNLLNFTPNIEPACLGAGFSHMHLKVPDHHNPRWNNRRQNRNQTKRSFEDTFQKSNYLFAERILQVHGSRWRASECCDQHYHDCMR